MLPVNHCSQSTVFGALNRKVHGTHRIAGETHRDGESASQAEHQHNVNRAGTSLLIAVLTSAIERCPKKYRGVAFFLFRKPKQSVKDCKA